MCYIVFMAMDVIHTENGFICLYNGWNTAYRQSCRGHDRMIVGFTTTYAISTNYN